MAAHLFKAQGYAQTTVRDLAKAVGLQSGSIFHHFATKEDILYAVMEETVRSCNERVTAAMKVAGTPRDRLKALVRCELESVLGETGESMSVLVYEWRALSTERQAELLEGREDYERCWGNVLWECKEEGLIQGDPAVIRRLLNGALGWTVNWFRKDGPLGIEDLAEQVVSLVVRE